MAQFLTLHPVNPEPRLIKRAADIVRSGGLIVYPTDSSYALGCHLGDKAAVERMRAIRQVDARHHFALVCRDLAEIATYAKVDNRQFRLLKAVTPGCYTFILQATREVPKRLQHPSRKTIGLRVPDHRIMRALLEALGEPLLTSTLQLPGDDAPLNDMDEIRRRLDHHVDLIIDGGPCGIELTTVINLTAEMPVVVREGKGSLAPFGL
ncbi:MAG: L-threonylcarbamoyladenylate synthase [Burkholderiales bacterium]|nr:L-threonylcarbamoyladenylate synthase [Burkholderiales bacterium]